MHVTRQYTTPIILAYDSMLAPARTQSGTALNNWYTSSYFQYICTDTLLLPDLKIGRRSFAGYRATAVFLPRPLRSPDMFPNKFASGADYNPHF